jgi:hypothetical protein
MPAGEFHFFRRHTNQYYQKNIVYENLGRKRETITFEPAVFG